MTTLLTAESARVWRFGSDVNTDQIVPGRYAPYMLPNESDLAKYPFVEAMPDFAPNVRPGDIIVAGPNFGCGSSREYAPLALKLAGVGAIISPLFARIFLRNALNLGIPCFAADLTGALEHGESVRMDVEQGQVTRQNGELIELPAPPAFMKEVWRAGGIIPYYREHGRFPGGE